MKTMFFLLVTLVFSISLTSCQEDIYLDEFSEYDSMVKKYSKEFNTESIDSIRGMVSEFNSWSKILSCVYCVEEGLLDGEILDYCRNNHKALLFIADSYFKGEDGSLKFTFQTMFKEFYPEEYDLLLKESGIQKAVEWRDMDKEYSLPMKNLFEKYIEIEFENN